MNFYEVARFQYAASRLLVKLAQFRQVGRFPKNISNKSNVDIFVKPFTEGSFNIDVDDPGQPKEDQFVDLSLGDLVAYISERVIEKIDEEAMGRSLSRLPAARADVSDVTADAVDTAAHELASGNAEIGDFPADLQPLLRRRVAEINRDERLLEREGSIKKIDAAREQKLIAMAAPLMSEMAVALRRSAETLEVTSTSDRGVNKVLFLDERMASDIETARVDTEITAILCDVVQFNKDNGWGKVKIENGSKVVSFSIPYDLLPSIKQRLIDTMKKDQVYLQTYFVRDRGGDVVRLIVAGILNTPTM
ncbi:hypothetical protein [Salipiger sp. HF18]|uniref:hypothetical protein n=1 Tax=Salipiger sp. HF18 TaxID=2721557 RepID=UPI001589C17C|nr:hypothetical protein [Salipiger sp. HF18]